jgi:multidrug efflux system membrane fusion protein
MTFTTDPLSPRPPQTGFWRRNRKPLFFGILVLIAVLVLVRVIHPVSSSQNKRGGDTQPVGIATAEKGDIGIIDQALGTVTPLATVTVHTQIAGILMQIAFTEGQEVKKGDFLAQVDPRPYEAALAQQEGQLAKDEAALKDAQIDLKRYQTLVEQDSISRQQLDTQIATVHQDEGAVKTDEASVANAKLNLVYCHITAPTSGRIGLRQVDQGNYVQTSDTNGIVVITQMQPMSVIFVLPADDLPAILKHIHAGETLQATAYDSTNTTKIATGTLSSIDNEIDTTTGTIKLRAMFDNADEMLFPNQFVNIALLVDTLKDATVIPTAAVQRGAPGTFVYLVKPDNTVAVTPVTLGPTENDRVAVLKGLNVGDQVVTDGTDKLKDGAKIKLPGESADQGKSSGKKDKAGDDNKTQNKSAEGNEGHHHHNNQNSQ